MSIEHVYDRARLVVLGSAPSGRPQSIDLLGGDVLVGRSRESQLYLDDLHVSRNHAVIRHDGGRDLVEDLKSSTGTRVNGVAVTGPTPLRDGDVITFATVSVRYETGAGPADTQISNIGPMHEQADAQFGIRDQHGRSINNIGRDQYNRYVQQVLQEREPFLREVARTKSKARVLVWFGFLLTVVGFVIYAWMIVRFIQRVPSLGPNSSPELLGPEVAGIPMGVFGLAGFFVGSVLLIVGIVLHIVASARRRRTDRDLPLPSPPSY